MSLLSEFYKYVLFAWANLIRTRYEMAPANTAQILTEPLFDNRFVTNLRNNQKHMIWCTAKISAVHQITYEVIPKIMPVVAISEILDEPLKKSRRTVYEHFTGIATELEKKYYDRNNETRPYFLHTAPSSQTTDTNNDPEL